MKGVKLINKPQFSLFNDNVNFISKGLKTFRAGAKITFLTVFTADEDAFFIELLASKCSP